MGLHKAAEEERKSLFVLLRITKSGVQQKRLALFPLEPQDCVTERHITSHHSTWHWPLRWLSITGSSSGSLSALSWAHG